MTTTTNYRLPVWSKTDRIRMADFNDMTAKIDTALAAQAASIAACGNCKIEHGTYSGTGQYGNVYKNTLTFSGQPLLVMVSSDSDTLVLVLCYKSPYGNILTRDASVTGYAYATWSTPNAVSWYHSSGAVQQMNSGKYHYLALVDAGE